jgi:DNA processing protein
MALSSLNVITLQNIKGIGPKAILKIGAAVESRRIDTIKQLYQTLQDLKIKKGSITMNELLDAEGVAKSIISRSEKEGIGVVSYYDDEFPEILRHCMNEEGKEEPPIVLYYKGDWSVTKMPGLAVIGTREMLKEGEKAGKYLAGEFVKRGFCIVSGLAIGCDTSGHRGALDAGGKTIAFLAHGLDSVYPPENTDLANEIVEKGGLLISEYPIGTPVNRYALVARDRLQAGMSLATLVVHTGIHGGTMHAVNTTIVENKPVYVVKFQNGELHRNEKVQGNDYLVDKKGAKYISGTANIDDIVKSINTKQLSQTTLF